MLLPRPDHSSFGGAGIRPFSDSLISHRFSVKNEAYFFPHCFGKLSVCQWIFLFATHLNFFSCFTSKFGDCAILFVTSLTAVLFPHCRYCLHLLSCAIFFCLGALRWHFLGRMLQFSFQIKNRKQRSQREYRRPHPRAGMTRFLLYSHTLVLHKRSACVWQGDGSQCRWLRCSGDLSSVGGRPGQVRVGPHFPEWRTESRDHLPSPPLWTRPRIDLFWDRFQDSQRRCSSHLGLRIFLTTG